MRKLLFLLAATTVVLAAVPDHSEAAVITPLGLGEMADGLVLVDQFTWRGNRYCWYNNGWRGPGWYRCGFRLRRGFGWGGPVGWHGWRRPGHGPVVRPPRPRPPSVRPPRPGGPGGNRPRPTPPG